MQIYHYHPQSGDLVGTGSADDSPLEPGMFLVPAHATTIEPPETATNQVAVFDGDKWVKADDYRGQEYWLADGSHHVIDRLGDVPPPDALIAPPTRATTVPASVTMRQARLALLQAGLLATVDAAVAAMTGPEGEAAKICWEYSAEVWRADPFLTQLTAALSMTNEQVDNLFTVAATL